MLRSLLIGATLFLASPIALSEESEDAATAETQATDDEEEGVE